MALKTTGLDSRSHWPYSQGRESSCRAASARSLASRPVEFPGGKIERNESPEQALARELNEELGIEAEIGPLRLANTHSYGDTGIVILFFEVQFWKGEPKTVHHMDLRWVYPSELDSLSIPDANKKMLGRIQECLRNL